MSGLEVIGSISAIITLLEASIKIYDSAQNDIKLTKTFEVVGRRLPVILHILQKCKNNLEPGKDSMPSDVCNALENILAACDEKATKMREIFEKVIPGEKDTWDKRYAKVIRRVGKGNKIEELMSTLTEDVQLIVNNHAVNAAMSGQHVELKGLAGLQSAKSSTTKEGHTASNSNKIAQVATQSLHTVTSEQKRDFSFHRPVGTCLGQAPYITAEHFVGRRNELDEITKILHPEYKSQKQQRVVLGGMGGVGKTQLAIAYAESCPETYSSVFWLDAASEAALKDSFRFLASFIFDTGDYEQLKNKEIVRHVHQWLSDPNNTGWLLIFDNYDDPDRFRIDHYYPPASHGAIVVTTRRPDLVSGATLHIRPFRNTEDSVAILQTRSKRENVQLDSHAKRLAERLAGLPLALATVGTYLRRSTFTFERYLQEYEKRWNVDPRRPVKLQDYQERTLYTTWDISYARLKIDDPDAAELLKLLAYFGNQSLWFDLFKAGITTSSPEWLYDLITDYTNFDGAMRVLTEYNFLDCHQVLGAWSMHNCVHDWTLAALNEKIDIEHYWYAFGCVDAATNGASSNALRHTSYSRLAGHATRLVQQRFLQCDIISTCAPDHFDKVSHVSSLLENQLQFVAAEQMSLQLLAARDKVLGPDHMSTLATVNKLGRLYRRQDSLDKAEQMYIRAHTGREKVLGHDHISTLETTNNLGVLYYNQGKLDKAEQMYMRVLASMAKTLTPGNQPAYGTLNNLGALYYKQGKPKKAEMTYIRAQTHMEKALGPNHAFTLNTINNLGRLYYGQRKLDKAGQMYMRVLSGREEAFGPDHILTLRTVNDIGDIYRDQGKLDKAKQMYVWAKEGKETWRQLWPDASLEGVDFPGHRVLMICDNPG